MNGNDWNQLVECAQGADIAQLADHFGIDLVRCGKGFRHREYDSLKVNGNLWKRWSGKTGLLGQYTQGRTVQLVQEYTGLSFQKAVLEIASQADPGLYARAASGTGRRMSLSERTRMAREAKPVPPAPQSAAANEPLRLPTRSRTAEDVFSYLTKERAIDPQIVERELRAGRLYQDTRKNCVFVGHDERGAPAFACIRATRTESAMPKMDVRGSQKKCSWRAVPEKPCGTVFAFESPIEAMSYMSILRDQGQDWTRSAFLSLGGVGSAALENYLSFAPHTNKVYLCLNNDDAGRDGTRRLLETIGRRACVLLPQGDGRDWNDALRDYRQTGAVLTERNLHRAPPVPRAKNTKENSAVRRGDGR